MSDLRCKDCNLTIDWDESVEAPPPKRCQGCYEMYVMRKLLWLRHGCTGPALYGDDGEMQCNSCMIDFKRFPILDIEKVFHAKALTKMAKYIDETAADELASLMGTPTQPPTEDKP